MWKIKQKHAAKFKTELKALLLRNKNQRRGVLRTQSSIQGF